MKWIYVVKGRGMVSALFRSSEARPTLIPPTGNVFQKIRDELSGLTDSERAIVLLNLCSVEAAETVEMIEPDKRRTTEKIAPTDPPKSTGGACAALQFFSTEMQPHSSTKGYRYGVSIGEGVPGFLGAVRYYVCDHCGCLFKGDDRSREGDKSGGDET